MPFPTLASYPWLPASLRERCQLFHVSSQGPPVLRSVNLAALTNFYFPFVNYSLNILNFWLFVKFIVHGVDFPNIVPFSWNTPLFLLLFFRITLTNPLVHMKYIFFWETITKSLHAAPVPFTDFFCHWLFFFLFLLSHCKFSEGRNLVQLTSMYPPFTGIYPEIKIYMKKNCHGRNNLYCDRNLCQKDLGVSACGTLMAPFPAPSLPAQVGFFRKA